ncbi:MAG: hypothetical protein ACRCT8_07375 [Lacipirellulaceae bacterium]
MMHRSLPATLASAAALFFLASPTVEAAVVGKAITPTLAQEIGVTAFAIGAPAVYSGAAPNQYWVPFSGTGNFVDAFGYAARDGGDEGAGVIVNNPNFGFLDDTPTFAADTVGVIRSTDFDNFFAVNDTVNPNTNDNATLAIFTATWTFDVTGVASGLSFKADIAAMEDFEPADSFIISYSFDGTTFSPLISSGILDTSLTSTQLMDPASLVATNPDNVYTMEDATLRAYNDPLTMNGTVIKNQFQTLASSIGLATSNSLQIRLTALADGGNEVFLLRNLTIEDGGITVNPGDFNDDALVNAADYTVWRDNLNGPSAALNGNGSGAATVVQADYDLWVANYNTGPASVTAIPEPAALVLATLAACGLGRRRNG